MYQAILAVKAKQGFEYAFFLHTLLASFKCASTYSFSAN